MSPDEIKKLRLSLGLSEEDVAAIFELTLENLAAIECGKLQPSKTMLMMLSLFNGLSSADAKELAARLRDAARAAHGKFRS